LMVAIMVLLTQREQTRWIAVLMSADGRPEKALTATSKVADSS